jgi:ABC-type branched-subunit amino acid transport system substrate-binding protein
VWLILAIATLAFAIVVPSATGSSHASTAKRSTVKIGIITTLGNPALDLTSTVEALVAGARSINRSGGLHGHPLAVEVCNDHLDPNLAAGCARQMASNKVAAVVGGGGNWGSQTQPILQAAAIPEIAVTPTSTAEYNGQNFFPPQAAQLTEFEAMIAYAAHKLPKPIIAVYQDSPSAAGFVTLLEGTLKQADGGSGFSAKVAVPLTTADWAPVAAAIQAKNPGTVLALVGHIQAQALLQAMSSQGSSVKDVLLPPSFDLSLVKAVGSMGNRIVTAQTYPPLSAPQMKPFIKDLTADAKRGNKNANINNVISTDIDAWVGLRVLFTVTKGLKTINAATVTAALQKAKNINLGGIIPAWTPSASGPPGFSRLSNQSAWVIGYKNGAQVALTKKATNVNSLISGKF